MQVYHDAEGNIASETEVGTVSYLTLENFTGVAGFENTSGYKEQCITGFSKMLEKQYNFYVDEGVLDRNVKLHEYLNGMMPREFEYSQYTEVWKKTVHSFLDVLVVPTMIEAVTGVEFITVDHLTDNEQAGKMQSSRISKYAACKVMKSVAKDGVMNMVTTELTEHDCELAARVLMFASMYVGMKDAPDFVDRYVEDGGLVKRDQIKLMQLF